MSAQLVRRLTPSGIAGFRSFLSAARLAPAAAPAPSKLLTAEGTSEPFPGAEVSIDAEQKFQDRFTFAKSLHAALTPIRAVAPNYMADDGLWNWLALAYFPQTCPDGRPGEDARHILSTDYKNRYRHLVRASVLVFELHGENSGFVLARPLHKHGEAAEQLFSRQHVLTNPALFAVFNALYGESGKNGPRLKRGATSKDAGGTLRRAGKVLRQFDLTFDLHAMHRDAILKLLPREFSRFKKEPKNG